MLGTDVDLAGNLACLNDEIGRAAARAGRRAEEVTLIGVSKTRPAEAVAALIQAGLRHVGENRVQEAADKVPAVRQVLRNSAERRPVTASDPQSTLTGRGSDIQPAAAMWHMIGHLQSNKAGPAVELFDRVDSVDSMHLAQALSRRVAPGAVLPVLVEVYFGDDPQRPGLRPEGLVETVGQIVELPGLRVEGLMTVPPLGGDPRATFISLRRLIENLEKTFPRVHFGVLSMGMSDDFVLAVEEGSTEVRVGTALFGPRKPR